MRRPMRSAGMPVRRSAHAATREAAGAAGGQQDVRALRGERDVVAQPPRQPAAEDAAKDDDARPGTRRSRAPAAATSQPGEASARRARTSPRPGREVTASAAAPMHAGGEQDAECQPAAVGEEADRRRGVMRARGSGVGGGSAEGAVRGGGGSTLACDALSQRRGTAAMGAPGVWGYGCPHPQDRGRRPNSSARSESQRAARRAGARERLSDRRSPRYDAKVSCRRGTSARRARGGGRPRPPTARAWRRCS